jgi:hypothetical protein
VRILLQFSARELQRTGADGSSRRQEALTSQRLLEQRKLEPHRVGCYGGCEMPRLAAPPLDQAKRMWPNSWITIMPGHESR